MTRVTNWDYWTCKGHMMVDGNQTIIENWRKYGSVEYVKNESKSYIVKGDINIDYRGKKHNVSMINGELIIFRSSTQPFGARLFTTSKEYYNSSKSVFIKFIDYSTEDVEKILSKRTNEPIINWFLSECEKRYYKYKNSLPEPYLKREVYK